MKDWTEQAITAGATIGVVLLFLVAVHIPRHRALNELRRQIQAQEQKLAQTQQRCTMLTTLTRQVAALRTADRAFDQRLPSDARVGDFLQQVAGQLRQAQLSSLEMRPASPVESPRYTELPIRLGFQGTFANIFSFLGQLEGLARTKRIAELDLTGDIGEASSVRADVTLSIFRTKG